MAVWDLMSVAVFDWDFDRDSDRGRVLLFCTGVFSATTFVVGFLFFAVGFLFLWTPGFSCCIRIGVGLVCWCRCFGGLFMMSVVCDAAGPCAG